MHSAWDFVRALVINCHFCYFSWRSSFLTGGRIRVSYLLSHSSSVLLFPLAFLPFWVSFFPIPEIEMMKGIRYILDLEGLTLMAGQSHTGVMYEFEFWFSHFELCDLWPSSCFWASPFSDGGNHKRFSRRTWKLYLKHWPFLPERIPYFISISVTRSVAVVIVITNIDWVILCSKYIYTFLLILKNTLWSSDSYCFQLPDDEIKVRGLDSLLRVTQTWS